MSTYEERCRLRRERLQVWHRKFAWTPVRLSHDEHEIRWLQFIYRKGKHVYMGQGDWDHTWIYAETEFDILKVSK